MLVNPEDPTNRSKEWLTLLFPPGRLFKTTRNINGCNAYSVSDTRKQLEKIQAPLFAINSADDEINPPELGILEREIRRVRRGRYILIPLADQTSDLQPCGALEESSSRAAAHLRAQQLI
jgi:pimeloyl-ACP methyl ester carboxylesterase